MDFGKKISKFIKSDYFWMLILLIFIACFIFIEFNSLFTSVPRLKRYLYFDFIHFYFPQINDILFGFNLKSLSISHWDQLSSAGTPKVVHSGLYYLPNYLLKIPFKLNNNFLPLSIYQLFVFGHYLMMAAGTFLFMRSKNISLWSAMFGAFFLTFSSIMLVTYWPIFIFAIALLPWILLFLEKYRATGKIIFLFLAAFLAFQQLVASQQFFMYSIIFIGIYLLIQDFSLKTAKRLFAFYFLTLIDSAIFLLPLYEFNSEVARINYINQPYLAAGAATFAQIKNLILFESSIVGLSLYFGGVALIVVVTYLFSSKSKSDWLILFLAVFFFLLSTYSSFFQSIVRVLPGLSEMRTHTRANELTIFALTLLLVKALSGYKFHFSLSLKVAGAVSALIIVFYSIGGNYGSQNLEQLFASLVVIGVFVLAIIARNKNLFGDRILLIIVALLVIFDLSRAILDIQGQQSNFALTDSGKLAKTEWFFGKDPIYKIDNDSRISADNFNDFDYNKFQIYRTYSAGSYSAAGGELTPATLKRYDDYLFAAKKNPNLLRLANIKTAENYLPRSFVTSCYRLEPDDDRLLAAISEKSFSGEDYLYLSNSPTGLSEDQQNCQSKPIPFRAIQDQDKITYPVINLEKPAILFISDNWYPGWNVFVNGERRSVLRANYTFKAVVLSPGENRVEFRFEPRSIRIGACISLGAFIVTILILIFGWFFGKKQLTAESRQGEVSLDFSIVIPVYYSEATLGKLTERIKAVFKKITQNYEVIFVDDGSKDRSRKLLREIYLKDRRFRYIFLTKNFGQHSAIIAGFHYVSGKYIITMDSDLQNPPEEIPKLIETIMKSKDDIVYGRYEKKQHSWLRNLGSELHYLMPVITSGRRIKITAFRIIRKRVVDIIINSSNPKVYIDALIFRLYPEVKIGGVSVRHESREFGKSNYNFFRLVKFALKYFSSYYFPLKKSGNPQFKIGEKWQN